MLGICSELGGPRAGPACKERPAVGPHIRNCGVENPLLALPTRTVSESTRIPSLAWSQYVPTSFPSMTAYTLAPTAIPMARDPDMMNLTNKVNWMVLSILGLLIFGLFTFYSRSPFLGSGGDGGDDSDARNGGASAHIWNEASKLLPPGIIEDFKSAVVRDMDYNDPKYLPKGKYSILKDDKFVEVEGESGQQLSTSLLMGVSIRHGMVITRNESRALENWDGFNKRSQLTILAFAPSVVVLLSLQVAS
ncbi:MAG: hypothetical protein Q9218_003972 [Villophora microphyllina]